MEKQNPEHNSMIANGNVCIVFWKANENRYEGSWKNGMKHGPGKFVYLDKGQLYEAVWVENIAKCGKMSDFGREGAPAAPVYPIPKVWTVFS